MSNRIQSIFRKLGYLKYFYRLFQKKDIVLIICSMRSGSTLLKSLLATSPDITHLPEMDFQQYGKLDYWKLKLRCKQRIIVLKKPAWYINTKDYPILPPFKNTKKIILVRDAYDVISSMKSMNKKMAIDLIKDWTDRDYVDRYWAQIYKNVIDKQLVTDPSTIVVRYEDLVNHPESISKTLFDFIGSEQKEGVSAYDNPDDYKWAWGNDDGSDTIKSLKVQKNEKIRDDKALLEAIAASSKAIEVRRHFGYIA